MPDTLLAAPLDLDALTDEALADRLVAIRRHLHQHPEVGFEVGETAAFLKGLLGEHGFSIIGPFAGEGFCVEIEGAHPGPTIGYRTELDALPAPDGKAVPYASRVPGAAHLCGHDAHMAVAFGVALLMHQRRDRLHGTVRVVFQPNEESTPSGAPRMMADGAIDGLREIFCIHVDPNLELGQFGLRAGAITAAAAPWMVHVHSGKAGHSARPHETVDTIWLASQILSTFYQLPGRVHDARRTAVLTACTIHGGEAFNVIPSEVTFSGTLRCINLDALDFLLSKMRETAEHLGALHGADVRFEADLGIPPVTNDYKLVKVMRHTILDLCGQRAAVELPEPSMGGEDFAYYLQEIPGALLRVGIRSGPETAFPLHHTCFDLDERALLASAHVMAEVLTRRLVRLPLAP